MAILRRLATAAALSTASAGAGWVWYTRETRFVWHTDPKDLEAWVQFITLDQLLNVADKLVE